MALVSAFRCTNHSLREWRCPDALCVGTRLSGSSHRALLLCDWRLSWVFSYRLSRIIGIIVTVKVSQDKPRKGGVEGRLSGHTRLQALAARDVRTRTMRQLHNIFAASPPGRPRSLATLLGIPRVFSAKTI